jgi:transposase
VRFDAAGKIVKEAKVATDPHVLVTFFKGLGFPVTRIGLEAGPLSHWLYAGLTQAGFDVVLFGDPPRQGSAVSDGGQDRPQGCAWDRAAHSVWRNISR